MFFLTGTPPSFLLIPFPFPHRLLVEKRFPNFGVLVEFYCEDCEASEHSARIGRGHIRIPLKKLSSTFSFTTCPKHKLPEDSYCFDDNLFICHRCRDGDHKPHQTKLVSEYHNLIKKNFQYAVSPLKDLKTFESEEHLLKQSQLKKQDEYKLLEQQMKKLKNEIQEIDSKLIFNQDNQIRCRSASLILSKSIEEYPIRDLFDPKKIKIMKSRINQTLKILSKPVIWFSESSIIKGKEEFLKILNGFFPNLKNVEPLYNAARNGWESRTFHQLCDGKPNTLVLIEASSRVDWGWGATSVNGGSIFGGFSPFRWNEVNSGYAPRHDDSFLFSLSNPTNSHVGVKFPNFGRHSIYCHPNFGPTFGSSEVGFRWAYDESNMNDFQIPNNGNQNSCMTNLGISYQNHQMSNLLCGAPNFNATNIEVFALTF